MHTYIPPTSRIDCNSNQAKLGQTLDARRWTLEISGSANTLNMTSNTILLSHSFGGLSPPKR